MLYISREYYFIPIVFFFLLCDVYTKLIFRIGEQEAYCIFFLKNSVYLSFCHVVIIVLITGPVNSV